MKLMEGEWTRGVGILLSYFKTNKEKDEYLHMYLKKGLRRDDAWTNVYAFF